MYTSRHGLYASRSLETEGLVKDAFFLICHPIQRRVQDSKHTCIVPPRFPPNFLGAVVCKFYSPSNHRGHDDPFSIMATVTISPLLRVLAVLLLTSLAAAQTTGTLPPSTTRPSTSSPPQTSASASSSSRATNTGSSTSNNPGTLPPLPTGSTPPDVLLRVPELHVGRIELDVDNLRADVNLAATIANLVELNAGVQVGVQKVNITIADVDAQLDLVVRLGRVAQMVNRTLASLDLNPALINLIEGVGDIVEGVVGAVDGLLGSIVSGDGKLNFLIDNLGNIVQEVVGAAGEVVSTIVGDYKKNMTDTGVVKDLGNGLLQRTFKYEPLGSLVNIVFNTLGQVVQAVVVGRDGNGGGGGGSSSSSAGTATRTATTSAQSSSTAA